MSTYAYGCDMAVLVAAGLAVDASVHVVGRGTSATLLAAAILAHFAGFVWWTFDGTGGVSA